MKVTYEEGLFYELVHWNEPSEQFDSLKLILGRMWHEKSQVAFCDTVFARKCSCIC